MANQKAMTPKAENKMALPPGVTAEMLKNAGEYNPPDMTEFLQWTPTQTGFAPYFEPFKGAMFAAIVEKADQRDINFPRYLFTATHQTLCRQGPKPVDKEDEDNRPVIIVPEEGHFTLGVFYGLVETLNAVLVYQYEKNVRVPIFIRFTERLERATKNGFHPWQFEVRLHPSHAKAIEQTRARMLGAPSDLDALPKLPAGPANGQRANA